MPTNFIIGQILMLISARELKRNEHRFWTKPLALSMAYAILIFVPVTGWYFYAHTGWSTVYLRDEALIKWWCGPIILSFYVLGMFFGSSTAQALIQNGQEKYVRFTLGLGVYWFLATVFLTRDEYLHIGTFAQFHAGLARPIFNDPAFMMEMNLMGAALALPAIGLAFYLRKRSKI
jgi:hypothetical protein